MLGTEAGNVTELRAGADDRDFLRERDERLEHAERPAHLRPGRLEVLGAVDAHLPLAVVAEVRGLEHGRRAQLRERAGQPGRAVHRPIRGDREAVSAQKALLAQPMPADV